MNIAGLTAQLAIGSVLLVAGIHKAVSPEQARIALSEIIGKIGSVDSQHVRFLSFLEATCGLALLMPLPGVMHTLILASAGVVFLSLGLAGRIRRSTAGCGCFGLSSRGVFGWKTALLGIGILAVALSGYLLETGSFSMPEIADRFAVLMAGESILVIGVAFASSSPSLSRILAQTQSSQES